MCLAKLMYLLCSYILFHCKNSLSNRFHETKHSKTLSEIKNKKKSKFKNSKIQKYESSKIQKYKSKAIQVQNTSPKQFRCALIGLQVNCASCLSFTVMRNKFSIDQYVGRIISKTTSTAKQRQISKAYHNDHLCTLLFSPNVKACFWSMQKNSQVTKTIFNSSKKINYLI